MTNDTFSRYDLHYQRMLNSIPDWHAAESSPSLFACRKPWLPSSKDAKILDVGCGWGSLLMSLWAAGYTHIEGVDISPQQVRTARQAACDRVPICEADAREFLVDREAVYDLVVIYDVIEHMDLTDALELLRLVYRSLKKGGTVAVQVPNASSLLASYSRYLDLTHKTMYTEYSLMSLLELAGFVRHQVVRDHTSIKWDIWRWWKPWRGLSIMPRLNRLVHQILYALRGQRPRPTVFGYNLEMYSVKPFETPGAAE